MDPSPFGNQINLTEHFANLSNAVYGMVLYLENCKTVIHLSEEQWNKFNPTFEKYLIQIITFVSDDAQSVVKRLGIILYRICMIFTTIRKCQTQEKAQDIQCLDIDFESALTLIEVYLQHSIIMFNNLPKQEVKETFKPVQNKKQFFDALPNRFTRKEAITLALTFNIKERTVGTLLKNCLGTHLTQPEYGVYEKIK